MSGKAGVCAIAPASPLGSALGLPIPPCPWSGGALMPPPTHTPHTRAPPAASRQGMGVTGGTPLGFDVGAVPGAGGTLRGLDLGVRGMHVGGRRKLIVPPKLVRRKQRGVWWQVCFGGWAAVGLDRPAVGSWHDVCNPPWLPVRQRRRHRGQAVQPPPPAPELPSRPPPPLPLLEQAYGSRGFGEVPPDATLDFDVELLSIKTSPLGARVKLVEG